MKFEKKVVSKQSSDGSTTTSSTTTNVSSNTSNLTIDSSTSTNINETSATTNTTTIANTNTKRLNKLFSDFEEKLNDVMEDILKESINELKVNNNKNKTRKYHTVKCRKTPKERPKSNYFEESDHVSFFNDLNDTKDSPKKQITVEKKFKIKKKYTVKKSYEIQELL